MWVEIRRGRLPQQPDVLVTEPTSLQLPELHAACSYYGMTRFR